MKRMQSFFRRSLLSLTLALSASLPLGLEAAPPGAGQALPVAALTVEKQNVAVDYTYPARTVGSRHVEIHARVGGILTEKTYTEGQSVSRGDLLYRIDDERYRAAVERAEAQLQMEQARLRQAQRDWQRVKSLYEDKAVSKQLLDSTLSELELAEAAVAAAEAGLNEARIDLKYTEVRAEIDGVTGLRQQDVGDLVGTSDDNSLLTTITQLDPIHVEFAIPDSEAAEQRRLINAGKLLLPADGKIRARLRTGNDLLYPLDGEVDYTDTRVDIATGSVRARAVFANPEHTLLPGQFVRVVLTGLVRPDVFAVPQKAVLQMAEQPFVYVISDGKAEFRPVTLAGQHGQDWLVESGLQPGEQIIVGNLIKVRPGAPVQAMPAQAPQQPQTEK